MVSTLLMMGVLLFFVSCEQNCQQSVVSAQEVSSYCAPPIEIGSGSEVFDETEEADALIFDARVEFINFDKTEEDKVYTAVEIIKKIIKTVEFKDRVLNFTFQGKKQFNDSKGLSNQEIYNLLLLGQEELTPSPDHEMDLELELYYSWKSIVGYTTPGEMRIYLNKKFFNTFTPLQVAGNIFHEWTHKLGFEHSSTYSIERDSSVPYALGHLVEELGEKLP